jgi:hypothetical protein
MQFDVQIAELRLAAARAVWERALGQQARADLRGVTRLIQAAEIRETAAMQELIAAEDAVRAIRGLEPLPDYRKFWPPIGSSLG